MYEMLFKKVLNPVFEKWIKNRKTLDCLKELESSQWLQGSEIDAIQKRNLARLLEHAYARVPYWKPVFDGLGLRPSDIKTYSDFCRLPFLTKQNIRNNESAMLLDGRPDGLASKFTGGSTGQPLKIYYTRESYEYRVANSKRGYSWAGCEDGRRQYHLWGLAEYRMSRLTRLKTHLHHSLLRHRHFDCFHFDDARKAECVRQLKRFRPKVIVGYPEALFRLARYVVQHEINLGFTVESVITGAEQVFDAQRLLIERVFGGQVFNSYGSREFMLLAMECPVHKGLHVSAENILLEVIGEDGNPVAPGQQGEVVVTDLRNLGMPFIRYRIGDLAIQGSADQSCPCGRGLPLLAAVSGRTLDMIRLRNGNEVPGEFFVRFVGNKPGVCQFRVTQETLSSILVELVVDAQFTKAVRAEMEQDLRDVLGEETALKLVLTNELEPAPTGKFRVTISMVAGNT